MARVYSKYTHVTGSFFVFSEHSSFTFFCYRCCCYFENEPSLLEDILHKVTLTKITSDVTQASGWARLSFHFFFFPTDLFCICTSYQRKLRWKGKTPRFSFLLLIGQSYKGKAQTSTWFRSSQVQSSRSQWEPLALSNSGLPPTCSGRCWRARKSPASERLEWCCCDVQRGDRQGGLWIQEKQHYDTWEACGAIIGPQKRTTRAPHRKHDFSPLNPHHQNCRPQN